MDRVYMDMAYEQAEKSSCLRAKVGAVLVLNGKVVAQGYNNMTGGINDCVEVGCIRKKLNIKTNTLEITENAVKYMRKSISYRMEPYYKEWDAIYNEFKTMATTDEDMAKIMKFLDTKEDDLVFNCNNFKIQNDYLEELRESNSKIMNIISERSEYFLGGSADSATASNTSLYKEIL